MEKGTVRVSMVTDVLNKDGKWVREAEEVLNAGTADEMRDFTVKVKMGQRTNELPETEHERSFTRRKKRCETRGCQNGLEFEEDDHCPWCREKHAEAGS